MSYLTIFPSGTFKIINLTENSKGFKVSIPPIENTGDLESYRLYLTTGYYSIEPNVNDNSNLLREINVSEENELIFYHMPKNTGLNYLTLFLKSTLGFESSGVLFSGHIPFQKNIKEVSIRNFNYYTKEQILNDLNEQISGGMVPILNTDGSKTQEITVNLPFALIGCQPDYRSQVTTEAKSSNNVNLDEVYYDFYPYLKDNVMYIYNRVVSATENNSGILFDNSYLRNTSNDIYSSSSLGANPTKSSLTDSINFSNIKLKKTSLQQQDTANNRYFLFDYFQNSSAYYSNNINMIEGSIFGSQTILYNPNVDTTGSFNQKLLNLTGVSGEVPKQYIYVRTPGHYNPYYIVTEFVDQDGFSSAGGNINNPTGTDRYSNAQGFEIIKVNHNKIKREEVVKMFKNYFRENNKIIFHTQGKLPVDIGLDAIVIFPKKYSSNINASSKQDYTDLPIFLNNLSQIDESKEINYSAELINSQNQSIYKITTHLDPNSLLLKDNIFSAKIYYLNSFEAKCLNSYITEQGFSLSNFQYYLDSTDTIDKYIILNKFIKNTENYSSTLAASYQGLLYFFTPESYPYISWPDEKYRNAYLNKEGARMLDFELDGVSSGPQFYNYFPKANVEIDNNTPSETQYLTSYRCLDSYKYQGTNNEVWNLPEDVPLSGVNNLPEYLGVYDPGNIGDQDSPSTPDFKPISKDLRFFKADNIYSIKVLSAGIQKEDAYLIVEFILDIPDAEDFIIQGISGTDVVLEKGIKEINSINYHYFVAKFVSSCGVDIDPILNDIQINQKNIIDSKKMISFLIYPTRLKIIEDPTDVPYFNQFYLFATDVGSNNFIISPNCPFTTLVNDTDCIDTCCVDFVSTSNNRVPYKNFYIVSSYKPNQNENNYPFGKIGDTNRFVLGSLNWSYKAFNYTGSNILLKYRKPTGLNNSLSFSLLFSPEHNVALDKVIIYLKQTSDVNNINWSASDIIDYYFMKDIVKSLPIHLFLPEMSFSPKGSQFFDKIRLNYNSWVSNGQTFSIKIYIIDKSGDTIEQVIVFENDESA